jgi:hypothetical protein
LISVSSTVKSAEDLLLGHVGQRENVANMEHFDR